MANPIYIYDLSQLKADIINSCITDALKSDLSQIVIKDDIKQDIHNYLLETQVLVDKWDYVTNTFILNPEDIGILDGIKESYLSKDKTKIWGKLLVLSERVPRDSIIACDTRYAGGNSVALLVSRKAYNMFEALD